MDFSIDEKVLSFIQSQPKQVRDMFLEILDNIPVLLEKIDRNLQANAFEFAVEAKDIITQYTSAIITYSMQYHKVFGMAPEHIWSNDEVKMVIDEAKRLYRLATDLIVDRFDELEGNEKHVHI